MVFTADAVTVDKDWLFYYYKYVFACLSFLIHQMYFRDIQYPNNVLAKKFHEKFFVGREST